MPRKATPKPRQWGDGSVSKRRKGGGWQGALSLGRGPDGRYRREYVYAATKEEAEAALARLRRQRQRGELTAKPGKVRLGDLLDRWLDRQRERVGVREGSGVRPLSPGTFSGYRHTVEAHIRPYLGAASLTEITPLVVEDWLAALVRRGAVSKSGKRRELSAASLHLARTLLRAVLEYAVDLELLGRNPARRIIGPPGKPADPREPYSVEETRKFLDAARDHRLGALCWLLAYTGLRRGEARGLTWADLDLDAGALRVEGQHQRYEGEWRRLPPKSRAGVRAIPLPPELVEMLRQRKAEQLRERVKAREWQASDLVFTTTTGRPLHTNSLYQLLTLVCRRAGIPYKSPHHHRHFFSSQLMAGSAPGKVQQRLMGHSGPVSTERYQHSNPDLERAAMDEIGRVIRGTIC